jgi:hypothetical protein
MRKKNGPAVANPVMEIDGSFRRLRGKIRGFLSNMKRHDLSPFKLGWILRVSLIKMLVNTSPADLLEVKKSMNDYRH